MLQGRTNWQAAQETALRGSNFHRRWNITIWNANPLTSRFHRHFRAFPSDMGRPWRSYILMSVAPSLFLYNSTAPGAAAQGADVVQLLSELVARHSTLATPLRGVLHSFSADWPTAEATLALGFCLGFTGPLTYKKADDLRAIAARVPLDCILIETDAPFLAPHPYRGKRNEPAYVRHVAERLAEVRGLSFEEVAAATTTNALRLFGRPTGSHSGVGREE